MTKLLIFPYNGNAVEALDCVGNQFEFIGFIDDTPEKLGKHDKYEVFSRDAIAKYKEAKVLAVPGGPKSYTKRKDIIGSLNIAQDRFATVIHHSASIANLKNIGFNTLIMPGVVVTSNAKVGNHVCVLPNTVIHHDSVIDDYVLIGSNVAIAGNVKINKNCYIGSGSNIINDSTIGECTLIGLGTNVLKDIPSYSKIVGNPGRSL